METKEYKLTDVCNFQGGTQPPKEEWINEPRDGYVRMLQIRDFTQGKAEYVEFVKDTKKLNKCNADDILIGRYGASVGKILTGLEGAYNVAIMKTIPDESLVLKKYLYYILTGGEFQNFIKKGIGARAAQAGFSKGDLSYFKLRLPSLQNQDFIIDLLDKADELIKKREQSISFLDELLKSIFLKMFYSNPAIKDWITVPFSELAEKKKNSMRTGPFGSSLLHSEFSETGDVRVLGIDNVANNKFEWKRSRCITLEKFQELKRYQVFPNDVLISIMATIGRTAVVPNDIPLCINSKHLAAITLNTKIANPHFVSFAFHSHPMILRQIANNTKGAIMDGLNLTIIQKLIFTLPPVELQDEFAALLQKIELCKSQYSFSAAELQNLFGSLSQKAFRGELTTIEKVKISGLVKIEPKLSGEAIVIGKINKELVDFHKSIPGSGAPGDIDNTLKQLDAELKIRGEVKFWDEYVKHRIIRDKFSGGFTFEEFWNEFTKVPFDEPQSYDKIKELIFSWLKTDNPFLKQTFNEKDKRIELSINETAST